MILSTRRSKQRNTAFFQCIQRTCACMCECVTKRWTVVIIISKRFKFNDILPTFGLMRIVKNGLMCRAGEKKSDWNDKNNKMNWMKFYCSRCGEKHFKKNIASRSSYSLLVSWYILTFFHCCCCSRIASV